MQVHACVLVGACTLHLHLCMCECASCRWHIDWSGAIKALWKGHNPETGSISRLVTGETGGGADAKICSIYCVAFVVGIICISTVNNPEVQYLSEDYSYLIIFLKGLSLSPFIAMM